MDFYGTFEHTIDGKGRLVMPSTFRSAFEGGGVAAMVEDYAALFTTDEWGRYRRKLEDSGQFTRDDLQWIFSLTSTFIPDAQNRISLPIKLRDHVGLGKDVTLIGSVRFVAVFPRQEWARREAAVAAQAATGPSIADKFRSLEFL